MRASNNIEKQVDITSIHAGQTFKHNNFSWNGKKNTCWEMEKTLVTKKMLVTRLFWLSLNDRF